MNKVIEQRIKQLISINFLKTANEITALSLLLNAIEKDFKNKHSQNVAIDKQIETRQLFTLNKIRNTFFSGDSFLTVFNNYTNNTNFNKLTTHVLFNVSQRFDNSSVDELIKISNLKKAK